MTPFEQQAVDILLQAGIVHVPTAQRIAAALREARISELHQLRVLGSYDDWRGHIHRRLLQLGAI